MYLKKENQKSAQNFYINNQYLKISEPYAIFLIFILTFLANSCVLNGEKEIFKEIESTPDFDNISEVMYRMGGDSYYDLLDTILLPREKAIEFKFPNGIIYGFDFYINRSLVTSGEGNRFHLHGTDFEDGYQEVIIIQYAKSGTNSLRDRLHLEYISSADTFTVLPFDNPPPVPSINSITEEDGTVVVRWDIYEGNGFQGYQVLRTYSKEKYADKYKSNIIDRLSTQWNDSLNVGRDASYNLQIDLGGAYIDSEKYNFESAYTPNFQISENSGSFILSWDKPPFYKNISYYVLNRESDILSDSIEGKQISHNLYFRPKFGEVFDYRLTAYSYTDQNKNQIINSGIKGKAGLGIKVPPQNTVVYNPTKEKYYCLFSQTYYNEFDGGIYELDKNLKVTNYYKLNTSIHSGHEQKFILSPDGSSLYHYESSEISKIDMDSLEVISTFRPIMGLNFKQENMLSASNNGLVTHYQSAHSHTFRVFDFASGYVLFDSAEFHGSSHLSFDGQLLLMANRIYSNSGDSFDFKSEFEFQNVVYCRFINSSNDILIATESEVLIYSLAANSVIKSFNEVIPKESYVFFEPSNMLLGFRKNDGWVFIDIVNDYITRLSYGGQEFAGNFIFSFRTRTIEPGYAIEIFE
jgi:hypothetical protein